MNKELPYYIIAVFLLAAAYTFWCFYKAARGSKIVFIVMLCWLIVQGVIGWLEFYTETRTLPPRFVLLIGPPLLLTAGLFATRQGRTFISGLQLKWLTALHIVRVPVELVLYGLFFNKLIPLEMTFEGRNPDILSGISAMAVWYFGYSVKKDLNKWLLLVWNLACLGLLLNIVAIAVLSAPTPFQGMAFEQPNTGVFYFPFVWLPGFIVPLVLLSHLAAITSLLRGHKADNRG